jgi:MerR family transcriptional regulator, light-induced transcriptional regulator
MELVNHAPASRRNLTHRHPMRVVTRRTGLTAELLRVWERRYKVVVPARTQTGRRLYSDADIERLQLLYRATLGGRSIGLIASQSNGALEDLVRQDAEAELSRPGGSRMARDDWDEPGREDAFVSDAMSAIERFDPTGLGVVLRRASVALSATTFLEKVVGSVLEQVGTRWHEGTLRPVHGHLAATVVRRVLERITVSAPPPSPRILLATVTGQVHELGALIAAAAAASEGWSVIWLGANLPVDDVAEAATALKVHAVGLSLIHPSSDVAVGQELRRLRARLPRSVRIIAGGAACRGYAGILEDIGATTTTDLDDFVTLLRDIARKLRAGRRSRSVKR